MKAPISCRPSRRPFSGLVHLDDGLLTEQRGAAADPSFLDNPHSYNPVFYCARAKTPTQSFFCALQCADAVCEPSVALASVNSSDLQNLGELVGLIEPRSVNLPGFVLLINRYSGKVDGGPVIYARNNDVVSDSCGQFLPIG